MATRGSALSRVVKYFRDEDLDVAVITLQHVRNIVDGRSKQESRGPQVATGKKRGRKPKQAALPGDAGFKGIPSDEQESLANA